jgi:hypothetical protein
MGKSGADEIQVACPLKYRGFFAMLRAIDVCPGSAGDSA